eukprot:1453437-Alexandrium_andersonii.AAC.1
MQDILGQFKEATSAISKVHERQEQAERFVREPMGKMSKRVSSQDARRAHEQQQLQEQARSLQAQ